MINSNVKITNWPGAQFPTFSIQKGYARIATMFKKDGIGYWMIGVSDIAVEETTTEYEQKPDENIIPLFALAVMEPEMANLLAKTFLELAEYMEYGGNENGTDDTGDVDGGDVRGDV